MTSWRWRGRPYICRKPWPRGTRWGLNPGPPRGGSNWKVSGFPTVLVPAYSLLKQEQLQLAQASFRNHGKPSIQHLPSFSIIHVPYDNPHFGFDNYVHYFISQPHEASIWRFTKGAFLPTFLWKWLNNICFIRLSCSRKCPCRITHPAVRCWLPPWMERSCWAVECTPQPGARWSFHCTLADQPSTEMTMPHLPVWNQTDPVQDPQ